MADNLSPGLRLLRARDLSVEDYIVTLGEARTVLEGEDLTIVTYGEMVHKSVEATRILEGDVVSVEVIDLQTLLLLDED